MRGLFVAFSAVLVSLSAHASPAAAVHDCGPLDSIGNLIGNVRSFGNGAIRVAYISTEEPVDIGAASNLDEITFYIEEKDLWYFDNHDLVITYHSDYEEPVFEYKKMG